MAIKRLIDQQGRIYGYAIYGYDQHGKRFYQTVYRDDGCYGTHKDAVQLNAETTRSIGKRTFIRPNLKRLTFSQLTVNFLQFKSDKVRPITLQGYEDHIRIHLEPFFGTYELGKTDFRELIRGKGGLIDTLNIRTYGPTKKPISFRYINKLLTTLYIVFEFAISEGYIESNPMKRQDRPKESALPQGDPRRRERHPMRIFSFDSIPHLLNNADKGPQRIAIVLGLTTGLRPGELRALTWNEINWQTKSVNVVRTVTDLKGHGLKFYDPKTSASYARVPIEFELERLLGLDVLAELKQWRLQSKHSQDAELVLADPIGRPFRKEYFNRSLFAPVVRRSGLDAHRVYDLRHTYASLLIALGFHPKHVQTRLRHESFEITMNIYGHLMRDYEASPKEVVLDLNKSVTNLLPVSRGTSF